MDDSQIKAMQEELKLKQMELDLIQAIDKIRDAATESGALLVSTVDFLADWFQVDLCLLFLIDREKGEMWARIAQGVDVVEIARLTTENYARCFHR